MPKVYSEALDLQLEIERVIGKIGEGNKGPCVVFFAGIHGNEPAGVFALQTVFSELKEKVISVNGTVLGVAGNLWALERGKRYHEKDLNRLWTSEQVQKLKDKAFVPSNEDEKQQLALYHVIEKLLEEKEGPFYFFDLHTTSSDTIPFLTVNDSLLNRAFSEQYPAPIILGIEEYLDGPLLSYINQLGYVSFGFESGRHNAVSSVNNHIAFIYLSLVFTGMIEKADVNYNQYFNALGSLTNNFYEIFYRYQIKGKELFEMEPGFINFQKIQKNQLLAKSNGAPIAAKEASTIFMPLYQAQGDDGFFMIRKISSHFLKLSAFLRHLHIDRILPILPGVKWHSKKKDALVVNLKVARFFTKPFLHLLGYRSKTVGKMHLVIKNREASSKNEAYANEKWKLSNKTRVK
jgi:predicted deacylase